MKFGGTSVATPEARLAAASRVVNAKEQGFDPVVVVSAIGRRGAPYATDTLIQMLNDIDPTVTPDARDLDLLMCCGEILSASVFAHTLKTLGLQATAMMGAQAGIYTDGNFGSARIRRVDPRGLLKVIEAGRIPVVCGFQGIFQDESSGVMGNMTTLGRGGSDTTGSAVGAALKADRIEIYTDVDGIKTADPDFVPNAPTLRKVSFDEVAEIAHLGAKVVHPRAAEIAMHYQIPLWVKNTFAQDEGTEVVLRENFAGRGVTGVTHTGKLVNLQFDLESAPESDRAVIEGRIYDLMARFGINLYMVNVSPTGTGFAVPKTQFSTVENLLDGLVVPLGESTKTIYMFQLGSAPSKEVEAQANMLRPLGTLIRITAELNEACTMVSLVGSEFLKNPGVYLTVLTALHESHIPVMQTSDSDYSISLLVPESETVRTVQILHSTFGLSDLT